MPRLEQCPGKRAYKHVVSLYPSEAEKLKAWGGGNLSRGVRKAWRARSRKLRQELERLVEAAIEADDMGEPVTEHLAAIRAHLDAPTRPWFYGPADGPPPDDDDEPQSAP